MAGKVAIVSLGLICAGLSGCVYGPVPAPPPRPVVYTPAPAYYAAPGYYAEPAYPAYGYYGGPRVDVDIGGRGGRWR